jgi:rSAM/selenodomain-associated transferase 2
VAIRQHSRISVIVPTLNEERGIGPCLDSVGEPAGVEVVISDGGSTDRTVEIARDSRPGATVVEGNAGRGGQLNRGAEASTGSRLLFLHADCRLPTGWAEALDEALADEATVLACFRLRTEPADGSPRAGVRGLWLGVFDLRSRGPFLPYGDQGYGVRREVFTGLGGFPEIPLMEDFAFARRCRRAGRIRRLPHVVRTTARRFERHPVKTTAILAIFPTLFRLGVSPQTLARWYGVIR